MSKHPYLDRVNAQTPMARGRKSETRAIKAMGARPHAASGAPRGAKSDASLRSYRLEMKSTDKATMALEMAWLVKIAREALEHGQTPAVVLSFVDANAQPRLREYAEWVLVPRAVFEEGVPE